MGRSFLITGAGGQLGRAFLDILPKAGHEVQGYDSRSLDLTDPSALARALDDVRPDWVINCAAATKVDLCESEIDWANAVNAVAPGHLADLCRERDLGLVHYSTDFVFDGKATEPYSEEADRCPLSVYGASKSLGEDAVAAAGLDKVLILRTQWVYGPGGRNFPAAILAKARAGGPLVVVDDQHGSPTLTLDLAEMSLELLDRVAGGEAASGIYHVANHGAMSWYDFAEVLLERTGLREVSLERMSSAELALPATRPAYSILDTHKLEAALGHPLPTVLDGINRYLSFPA
jgi:dTDP-4-dehydrorhamnose reductase